MNEITDDIYAVWQHLRRRNDWHLVKDEMEFLTSAAAELAILPDGMTRNQRLFIALQRTYSVLLYRGLWNRDEQSAREIWLSLLRIATKRGWEQIDAEDLAQEAITRIIEKLHFLRSPQSLLMWALQIIRTAERDKRKHNRDLPSYQDDDNLPDLDSIGTFDPIEKVEQRVISQELQAKLNAKLPNELERLMLTRLILFGDNPRDVARDLGIPLHRARTAKSRALKRLREDAEFLQFLDAWE